MRQALLRTAIAASVLISATAYAPKSQAEPQAQPQAQPQPVSDGALCEAAIRRAEAGRPLPPRLMSAIAVAESGRALPGGRVAPWPWTINVGGVGSFFPTAEAAIAAVQAQQAAGVRSIDVGCMQVNLMHHPNAFASLSDAFDPATNAAYAATFLLQLHATTPAWPDAVGAYHSRDPELAAAYRLRVAAGWPDAAQGVGSGLPAAPASSANHTPEFSRRLAQAAQDRATLINARLGRTSSLRVHAKPLVRPPIRMAASDNLRTR